MPQKNVENKIQEKNTESSFKALLLQYSHTFKAGVLRTAASNVFNSCF